MKENFPNLAKEIDFQEVQEAQRVPKKLDPRRNTPRHIIITSPNIIDEERILKTTREKETVIYKGIPIRLSADFSKESLQVRRGWKEVLGTTLWFHSPERASSGTTQSSPQQRSI